MSISIGPLLLCGVPQLPTDGSVDKTCLIEMTREQALELYTARFVDLAGSYSFSGSASMSANGFSATISLSDGSGNLSQHLATGYPSGCPLCSFHGPSLEPGNIQTPQYWADYTVSPVLYYVFIPILLYKAGSNDNFDDGGARNNYGVFVDVRQLTRVIPPINSMSESSGDVIAPLDGWSVSRSTVSSATFTLSLSSGTLTGKIFTIASLSAAYYNLRAADEIIDYEYRVYIGENPDPADYPSIPFKFQTGSSVISLTGSVSGSASLTVSAIH